MTASFFVCQKVIIAMILIVYWFVKNIIWQVVCEWQGERRGGWEILPIGEMVERGALW